MSKQKMRLIPIAAGSILLLMLAYTYKEVASQLLDPQNLRTLAQDNIHLLKLVMLLVMIVQNMFTIIPLILVISINISLFGLGYGYVWSVVTSILAAFITFYIVRLWLHEKVARYLKQSSWMDKMDRNGYWFVFMGRLIPFVPTSLVNIASGAGMIKVRKFIAATAIGNALYFLALSLIAQGFISAAIQQGLYAVFIAAVLGYASFKLWKYYRPKNRNPEPAFKSFENKHSGE